ncbi:hypothetical protein TNCV_2200421 [Trichonephila clavipes]|nr:hypothetical protein TNCV_2200421 [Trichonephila clavipes]
MSRRKQRSTLDQVSEFDRGGIVAYGDCGSSFRKIGSHVGRKLKTVLRICDRRMQEESPDWGGEDVTRRRGHRNGFGSLHSTRFAPNFLFPIPIQIISTANREETQSTAASNKIAFLTTTRCHSEPADAYVIPHCTILTAPSPHRSPS